MLYCENAALPFDLCCLDYNDVLKLEPDNRQAKAELDKINKQVTCGVKASALIWGNTLCSLLRMPSRALGSFAKYILRAKVIIVKSFKKL